MQQGSFVGRVSRGKATFALVVAGVTLMALAWLFAAPVHGAQEATAGGASARAGDAATGATAKTKNAAAKAGEDASAQTRTQERQFQAQVAGEPAPPSGPIASEVVQVVDRNRSGLIDRGDILEIRTDCTAGQNASITVEDGNNTPADDTDNTQGTFVHDQNSTITEADEELRIEVTGDPIGVVAVEDTTGDEDLTVRGVEVVTSTDIQCAGDATPDEDPDQDRDQDPNQNPDDTPAVGAAEADVTGDDAAEAVVVGRTAAERQYQVIVHTIPEQKKLVATGGMSLGLLLPGLLLLGVGLPLLWRVIRHA